MKDYSGLENFQSQQVMYEILGKNPFLPRKQRKYSYSRVIFRNAKSLIDFEECTKTLSLLNTLMLRCLWKVKRISSEFLADIPNDLPYILCCDWTFSPWVNMASNWHGCIYGVRRRKRTPSLAALWLSRKNKGFLAPIRSQNYPDHLELVC